MISRNWLQTQLFRLWSGIVAPNENFGNKSPFLKPLLNEGGQSSFTANCGAKSGDSEILLEHFLAYL